MILPLMLFGMWFWKASNEGAGTQSRVAYSQLYQWIEQGKVESVVLNGESLDATLKSPEAIDGKASKTVSTNAAPSDAALLPLLRLKGVQITVKSQQQPFGSQQQSFGRSAVFDVAGVRVAKVEPE